MAEEEGRRRRGKKARVRGRGLSVGNRAAEEGGESCRDSPIRTWPRAFQGIGDVKPRGWRLLITSLASHGIDQSRPMVGELEAVLAIVAGAASRENITNSRLPRSIN